MCVKVSQRGGICGGSFLCSDQLGSVASLQNFSVFIVPQTDTQPPPSLISSPFFCSERPSHYFSFFTFHSVTMFTFNPTLIYPLQIFSILLFPHQYNILFSSASFLHPTIQSDPILSRCMCMCCLLLVWLKHTRACTHTFVRIYTHIHAHTCKVRFVEVR